MSDTAIGTAHIMNQSASRLPWVDVAKGATILLVVLNHAISHLHTQGWALTPMLNANNSMQSFRMPLFFFASGLFFFANLAKPWATFMRTKFLPLLYLFALWVVIQGTLFWALPWKEPTFGHVVDVVVAPLWPTTGLWYVYALALYSLAARLLRLAPMMVQVALVLAVSGASAVGLIPTGNWAWDSILSNFVFFFSAIHMRNLAFRFAQSATWLRFVGLAGGWATLVLAAYFFDFGFVSPLRLPMSVLAISAGVMAASLVTDTWAGRGLCWVGKRTLPIFVLHIIFILAARYYLPVAEGAPSAVLAVAPVILAGVSVVGSFALWYGLRHVPGLFEAPWLRGRRATQPGGPCNSPQRQQP